MLSLAPRGDLAELSGGWHSTDQTGRAAGRSKTEQPQAESVKKQPTTSARIVQHPR